MTRVCTWLIRRPKMSRLAWSRHPDASGALIVSPTPYGTCDIKSIAAVCHARGKPLIVDEAWGAHLPFHDDLPTWAMDAGADVCVVSVHKMGMGFEQGSVFHLQGNLIDPDHLSACADLLTTTSPNVLIYSAIDGWRRQMVRDGRQLLGAALELAGRVRQDIEQRPGLHACTTSCCASRQVTTSTGYTSSSTSPNLVSAAIRPPTGCARTGPSTWAYPIIGGRSDAVDGR